MTNIAKIAPPLPEGRCHVVTEGRVALRYEIFQCIVCKKQTAIFFNHRGFDYLYHKYYLII